jgi:hypothetical protein
MIAVTAIDARASTVETLNSGDPGRRVAAVAKACVPGS